MRADVHRFSIADPSDVSGLKAAIDSGAIDASQIVAVIGKTHGNGLVNDYTRGYLTLCLSILIGERTGRSPEAVREKIPFVFSGGVEGVLSPHYTVFTVAPDGAAAGGEPALAIGVAFTAPMRPSDIGRQAQIDAIAASVTAAIAEAAIEEVHFVQVKGPAFTLADILEDQRSGRPPATDNPGKLMSFGRAACALGVAKALGEVPADKAVEAAVLKDFSLYSSVASMSAGVEVDCNEVIVVGMSRAWSGPLAIEHTTMTDALDVASIHAMVQRLGFSPAPQMEAGRVRAAFIKCEAQRDGLIRGRPHTMLNDGDINEQRHIRGAVGAIAASILNDTGLFVSGGAEHQGPDGGGMIAVIADRPDA
ncbi:ring-opening amidohydrolase [Labrys monachus]|uniref:Cyclic amide hydrolase n=1 Tax=Labrys monachus TaxID=217067 RepID=A0ABU0FM63_9HYPH|nr:ring-opening amidohydrolase [Labrys monachus]MDQ0395681.1 cyanuric acid amidohydrolase [Labrys monachus]